MLVGRRGSAGEDVAWKKEECSLELLDDCHGAAWPMGRSVYSR